MTGGGARTRQEVDDLESAVREAYYFDTCYKRDKCLSRQSGRWKRLYKTVREARSDANPTKPRTLRLTY